MNTKALSVRDLLNQWDFHIKTQNFEKADASRKIVEENIQSIKEDPQTHANYLVTKYGYDLLNEQYDEANKTLEQIQNSDVKLDNQLLYRFYLAKGLHAVHLNSHFDEALQSFKLAEKQLAHITDELDKVEYDYKMAGFYYQLEKPLQSVQHVTKAVEVYKKHSEYKRKSSSCENILGLNCIDMRQYEQAEEHFHSALDYASKTRDKTLRAEILHNLGILYAEQNMSSAAIHWLKENLKVEPLHYLTAYELCKENFKIGYTDEALSWLQKGINLCNEMGNQEFLTRFSLLEAFYLKQDSNQFVKIYEQGISYFQQEKLWKLVEDYSVHLASYYREKELYKSSTDYYALALKARDYILNMEGLN